jgi:hypothetical protein
MPRRADRPTDGRLPLQALGRTELSTPEGSVKTKELFVVICEDRRVDDSISVHETREGADDAIAAFCEAYGDTYKWNEQNYGRDRGWVRYVDTNDDGPSARIEKTELQT